MIWDSTVTQALLLLLGGWGMDSTVLVADRLWDPPDPFTLPVVASVLDNPLNLSSLEPSFHHPLDSLPSLLSLAHEPPRPVRDDPEALLRELGRVCAESKAFYRRLQRELRPVLDSLVAAVPDLVLDEEDSLLRSRWGELNETLTGRRWLGDTLPDTTLFRLLRRVPFREIWAEGFREQRALHDIARRLAPHAGRLPPGELNLPGCRIWVGTWGRDIYAPPWDYDVILEPGGDDRYMGVPAGMGRVQVVLDFEGNDLYEGASWGEPGGALFGSAWIVDLQGDDTYRGRDLSLGAGFGGSAGVMDFTGDDVYRCGQFCLGASAWGLGLVLEGDGHDLYHVDESGEAFARTGGLALLLDEGGNDGYLAGATRLHEPLQPDMLRGFAQGFAFGYRPHASGGIALLVDRKGHDRYSSPVYGQGAAYWKGLGVLVDEEGSDVYEAVQYAQGAGIHLAVGVLMDGEGRDRYASRFGPALGEGHDLSVGVLVDGGGDDLYEVSGGLGLGLANSIGILVDRSGNDLYRLTEPRGLGDGDTARGTGSLGLFADLSGQDVYLAPGQAWSNGTSWVRGEVGFGMDASLLPDTLPEVPPDTTGLQTFLDTAGVASLYQEARTWGVGSRRIWVRRVREALAERGGEALRFLIPDKLRDPYPLNWRVLKAVVKKNPDTARPLLRHALAHPSDTVQGLAVRLLAEIRDAASLPAILKLWDPGKSRFFRRAFLRALATLQDSEACSFLEGRLRDTVEVVRAYAATAWGTCACPPESLLNLLADRFPVAQAAFLALREQDLPEDTLLARLEGCSGQACGFLVRLVGERSDLSWHARERLARLPEPLLRFLPDSVRRKLPISVENLPATHIPGR